MLEMIALAGDFVGGAVWHRIIQIVTNHKDLQVCGGGLVGAVQCRLLVGFCHRCLTDHSSFEMML